MGEVVALAEGYVHALQSKEPGTKWLNDGLWPKLRPLFYFIEELDQSRMDMRDSQHKTFVENEELKQQLTRQRDLTETWRDKAETSARDVLRLDGLDKRQEKVISELRESLEKETALVIENARKYEEMLKRNDDLVMQLEAAKDKNLSKEEVSDECSTLRRKLRMAIGLATTLRTCSDSYAAALTEFINE